MTDDAEAWRTPLTGPDVVRTAARAYERDRYLAALLAPRDAQPDLIALAAFAGEVARIPTFVTEPMMGEIRLQWWRDALAKPPGESAGHPIADAVRDAVRRHGLPVAEFERVIDAHASRLHADTPADDSALAVYLAGAEATLFQLSWRVLASPQQHDPPDVLTAAAQAYGTARMLLELPAHLAEGRTLIPESRLAAAGVTLEQLRAGTAGAAGEMLLRGLTAGVRHQLNTVRGALRDSAAPVRLSLLPLALVEPYLRALERVGSDPRSVEDVAPFTRVWRLWIAHRLGRL